MEKAQELLIHTQKKIKEIAFLVGYKDELYFSKVFARLYGMSPSKFRKTMLTWKNMGKLEMDRKIVVSVQEACRELLDGVRQRRMDSEWVRDGIEWYRSRIIKDLVSFLAGGRGKILFSAPGGARH